MALCSIYNFIVKRVLYCCYEDKSIKSINVENDIPVIVPVLVHVPVPYPSPSPESIDSNLSSTLSKFFNRQDSFETISELGLMRNNIKHFYNLTDSEKRNLYNLSYKEKIELILLYDKVLYAIKQEYTFFPIEKT